MNRILSSLLILLSLLFLPELAFSTKIKSFWRNPSATPASLQFEKVLVVAIIQQDLTRKVAEDKTVQILKAQRGIEAVPSYMILDKEDLKDQDRARSKIANMSFDGAIVMKYAGAADQRKYDADESESVWYPYNQFWGYYSAGWGAAYNATTPNDLTLFIETMLYSLKEEKLIWAGISETKDPKNPAKVVAEVAEVTAKHLQKEGLITKK